VSRARATGTTFFFLQPLQPILPVLSHSFRAQERSRTALLQRRRRLVLDGSEHGRTMMGSGEPNGRLGRAPARRERSLPAELGEAVHDLSSRGTQTDAATIATRRAETRIAGLGRAGPLGPRDRAWPDRREGAAQILRICLCKRIRLSDGRPMPGARFFTRSDLPASAMGFVEKMPHMLPTRCVWGPPRSLRGQSARRPGRDAFRSRGSSLS
jgi:hypothetical protein